MKFSAIVFTLILAINSYCNANETEEELNNNDQAGSLSHKELPICSTTDEEAAEEAFLKGECNLDMSLLEDLIFDEESSKELAEAKRKTAEAKRKTAEEMRKTIELQEAADLARSINEKS